MMYALHSKDKLRWFWAGGLIQLLFTALALFNQQFILGLVPLIMFMGILLMQDMRKLFILLLITLPISFNLEEKMQVGIDFPDEPLMLLITMGTLFFIPANWKQLQGISWKHPIVLLIGITLLWTTITVIFSMNPSLSVKYLLKRIWYIMPFFIFPLILFSREQQWISRSFLALCTPLFVLVILIIYRYSAFGFRFEDVHDPVQPFFQNHVMYGSMVSCLVPWAAGAWLLQKRFSGKWLLSFVVLTILLLATYLSYSRAAWMAVLFAGGTAVAVRFRIMNYAILIFYICLFTAVVWLSRDNHYLNYRPRFEKTIMHESLTDHIMATIQGTDISSAERYYRWIASVRMSTDHPITGVGPNNFYDYYKAYTITSYRTWVSRNLERSTTHNYFLYMLVEQGYPGMILYGLLIFTIFASGQYLYHRLHKRNHRAIVLSTLAVIGAVFINNFFSELLETDKIGSLFLLGLSVLVALSSEMKQTMADITPSQNVD